MNNQYIINYLNENNKDTNSLKIHYDFSGISGLFVPNALFLSEEQFGKINSNFFVNKEYNPGIFVSCYNEQNYTGSGIFQGKNTLKVLNNLSGDAITLFYNFGNINCGKNFTINNTGYQIPTGYTQVLSYIQSKENLKPFEIILGLNDLNKLTLEFSGSMSGLNEMYKSTNFVELGPENIVTIRLNQRNIEYTYFDIIEDEIHNRIVTLSGEYFNQEKDIYVGNLPFTKTRNSCTGYFGFFEDFVAYNQYINIDSCYDLSKIFLKTGELINKILITGLSYNMIEGAFLNPTGVLGTGITGYVLAPSNETIDSSCGSSCTVYIKSGVVGLITGEKIEYMKVDEYQSSLSEKIIKVDLYDEENASRFTKKNIIFNKKLDNEDIFEIQLYKDSTNREEYPTYAPIEDVYVTNENLNNKNLLIFVNGVNIKSGDYEILNNANYKFKINNYNEDYNDLILYSISNTQQMSQINICYTGQEIENFINKITFSNSIVFPEANGVYTRSTGYHTKFIGPLNDGFYPAQPNQEIWWNENEKYWVQSYYGEPDGEQDWISYDLYNWLPAVAGDFDANVEINYLIEGTVNMFLNGQKLINNYNLPYKIKLENWGDDSNNVDINGEYEYLYNITVDFPPYFTINAYKHTSLSSWIYFDAYNRWTLSTTSDTDQWTIFSTNPNILPLSGWNATNSPNEPGRIHIINILDPNKVFATGDLLIIGDNYNYKVTGSNIKTYSCTGDYNNERIWLNGIFQNKNENYILTSCNNTALISNNQAIQFNESIFTGEYYRFNLV